MIANARIVAARLRGSVVHGARSIFSGSKRRIPHARHLTTGFALLLIVCGALSALSLTLSSTPSAGAGAVCQSNSQYALPYSLELAGASSGLHVQDDGIVTYGVGGTTVDQIRDALNTCAPSFTGSSTTGEYLAYTSYAINWKYDIAQSGATCHLANVSVGLHLSQLEPRFTTTAADAAIHAKWNAFIEALQTHENGHKQIDIDQASTLLAQLNGLNEFCATIARTADSLTTMASQNLVVANAEHDTDTDYGRDQGASW